MDVGPNIPQVGHETFARPPLKAMLGQVRFPPVLKIADLAELGRFQDTIRTEWPEFAQEQQMNLAFGPQGMRVGAAGQAFRFTAADKAWSALLAPEGLTLEAAVTEPYTSYDDFLGRFSTLWSAVLERFSPTAVTRQGLRYVDHIEGDWPAEKWRALINEELLGPLGGALSEGLEQAVSELHFRRAEGLLLFKHGVVPAGPENKKGYLLDFDYYSEEPSEDVSVDAVRARFDQYHAVLYDFFRWCVTDEALEGFRHGN